MKLIVQCHLYKDENLHLHQVSGLLCVLLRNSGLVAELLTKGCSSPVSQSVEM